MPKTYTRKDGTVAHYKYSHGNTSGTPPNLTLVVDEGTREQLVALAAALGLTQSRGANYGQGSISQLADAIADATQRHGVEDISKKFKAMFKQKLRTSYLP